MESCTDADSKNATEWTKLSGWVGSSMCSTSSTAADIGASNRARMLRAFETYGCNKELFDELVLSYAYLRETNSEEVYCNVALRPDVTAVVQGVPFAQSNVDCGVAQFIFKGTCTFEPTICADNSTSEEKPISEWQEMKNEYESYGCSPNANNKIQPYLKTTGPDVSVPDVAECLSSYATATALLALAARPPVLADAAAPGVMAPSVPPPVLAGTCASPSTSTSAGRCPRS